MCMNRNDLIELAGTLQAMRVYLIEHGALYTLARLERDVEAARRVKRRAPKWKAAADLVKGLREGRLPRWPR